MKNNNCNKIQNHRLSCAGQKYEKKNFPTGQIPVNKKVYLKSYLNKSNRFSFDLQTYSKLT